MAGGRPALFSTPEDMIMAVENYFEWLKGEYHDELVPVTLKDGSTVMQKQRIWDRYPEQSTITGLALHLGFESRQSIYDYEKDGEFSYIIKNARLRVEKNYELTLFSDKPTGAIFALKNMGWKDQTQTDITTGGEKLQGFNYVAPE